jgi:hypothetical protein
MIARSGDFLVGLLVQRPPDHIRQESSGPDEFCNMGTNLT